MWKARGPCRELVHQCHMSSCTWLAWAFYEAQHELEGGQYTKIKRVSVISVSLWQKGDWHLLSSPYLSAASNWILQKVEIKDQNKIATVLRPKYSQLRMFTSEGQPSPSGSQTASRRPPLIRGEGPAPKKAIVGLRIIECKNLPMANVRDEVEVSSIKIHTIQDDSDVLGWWRLPLNQTI